MKKEYDFSKAKRGPVVVHKGKTRVTMFLDDAVIGRFKDLSDKTGRGYQTLINEALNTHLGLVEAPLTLDVVRRIVREELASQT